MRVGGVSVCVIMYLPFRIGLGQYCYQLYCSSDAPGSSRVEQDAIVREILSLALIDRPLLGADE